METLTVMGCDPHLDTISAAVVDQLGRELEAVTVRNDNDGHLQLSELAASHRISRVGIEGASGHGVNLSRVFHQSGFEVVEIPTRLTARTRKMNGAGKTDPGDARTIAQATARGEGHRWADTPDLETIRVLTVRRERLVGDQTADINHLRALVTELDPALAGRTGRIRSRRSITQFAVFEVQDPSSYQQILIGLIREIATTCLDRLDRIRILETLMLQALPPAGHALIDQTIGCGLVTACQLLAQIAGTSGFATDPKFAAWTGTACLDASSGRQQHHRLNPGGNRQANRALHTIILTQHQLGGEAHHYITRRISEGKTRREATRAAKRYVARRIWKILRDHELT